MDDDTPYQLAIACESDTRWNDDCAVSRSIQATLQKHNIERAWVNVTLVDDARIAELNEQYLHHSGPTDVISFNLGDEGVEDRALEGRSVVEGEIVLSVETAMRESKTRGHRIDAEVALYAVHGLLHLLGYDDHQEAEADRMHAMEDEILESVGLGPVYRRSSL